LLQNGGKAIETNPSTAEIIVACVCLLHNIVIESEGINAFDSDYAANAKLNRPVSKVNNSGTYRAYIFMRRS
jgi:hypothetical protein